MDQKFEWDEFKRTRNIEKHRIDFVGAQEIFSGAHLVVQEQPKPGETWTENRWKAVGMLNGMAIAVIYTKRDGKLRIISARPATRSERNAYQVFVS